MSAFLGPIHHWLYNKILFQDKIVDNIIAFSDNKGLNLNLKQELSLKYGELEQKPLEDIIESSNIHGWLQERISLVEYRLAEAVTNIIKTHSNTLPEVQDLFYKAGKENIPTERKNAVEFFNHLNDILLDGMPCDRANETLSESDDEVVWKRNICVHQKYWDAVGGDIAVYYLLRESLIKGMLDGSDLAFEQVNDVTSRVKRG